MSSSRPFVQSSGSAPLDDDDAAPLDDDDAAPLDEPLEPPPLLLVLAESRRANASQSREHAAWAPQAKASAAMPHGVVITGDERADMRLID
jgi:hypothetical protein